AKVVPSLEAMGPALPARCGFDLRLRSERIRLVCIAFPPFFGLSARSRHAILAPRKLPVSRTRPLFTRAVTVLNTSASESVSLETAWTRSSMVDSGRHSIRSHAWCPSRCRRFIVAPSHPRGRERAADSVRPDGTGCGREPVGPADDRAVG